jgi:chemotaxis protein methyltransferase CheR
MTEPGPAMLDSEFRFIADMVYQRSRIVISPHKRPMLQGRLAKRLRALQLRNVSDYIGLLKTDAGEAELSEMLNAVTTNVTAFFREVHHFRHLANVVLPELLALGGRQRKLRIWSAGCSTGQEPYSIAMTMHSALQGRASPDLKILATDLDTNVLAHARAGRYRADQATGIPPKLRANYVRAADDQHLQIDPRLQALISFKPLNLMESWPMRGSFDVVFCRNVVIYFDKPTQARLFERIATIMAPSGWLYIGHSESLFNVTDRFQLVGKTTYRKVA